ATESCSDSGLGFRGGLREAYLTFASFLGVVHGGIRTAEDGFGGIPLGQDKRDADACADLHAVVTQLDRLSDVRDDEAGNLLRLGRIGNADERDDKLITAGT